MFQRLKRLYKLSKKDPKVIDALTNEQIKQIPDVGDGKAEFISMGTQEDYDEQVKQDSGIAKWYERLKNL